MAFLNIHRGRITAAIGLMILAVFAAAVHAAEVGRITRLEGQADATRRGNTFALKLGDAIEEADVLRTKRRSSLEAAMTDGSHLTLGESTRLEIAQYVTDHEPAGLLDLARGRVRSVVSETFSGRAESFKVRTPTAIAGVQGTDFLVVAGPARSRVLVFKGLVAVTNADPNIPGKVLLGPGMAAEVTEGQPPTLSVLPGQPTVQQGQTVPVHTGGSQDLQSGGSQFTDPAALTPGTANPAQAPVLPALPNLP